MSTPAWAEQAFLNVGRKFQKANEEYIVSVKGYIFNVEKPKIFPNIEKLRVPRLHSSPVKCWFLQSLNRSKDNNFFI